MLQRVKVVQESDLRMLGNLARNIQRVLPVTQADIDAAAALGKGWVVWKVVEVNDPLDNLRGGTQLVIKQNSITPGQNVRRVLIVSGPGGETVVIGPAPSPLLLPDAIADSLTYVKAFGGTEQNGTPTPDAPMDIVCNNGVLKFTANEANYIADNVTLGYWIRNNNGQPESSPANFYTAMMPVKPGVSYVCFGLNKETNVISGYNRIAWYDADGVWIRNSTYTQNQPGIDVAPSNAAFARFHCNINGTDVTQELVDSYNWVFQQGTAEVPYKPYSPTGIYTDGTVETIQLQHQLELPTENTFGNITPEFVYSYNSNADTVAVPVTVGKQYVIRWTNTTQPTVGTVFRYGFVSDSTPTGQAITQAYRGTIQDLPSNPIVVTADNSYLLLQCNQNYTIPNITNGYLTVSEVSNTATTEMLLKVGDYQDVQSIIDGVVTRNVGVKVFDGSEMWNTNTLSNCYSLVPGLGSGNFTDRTVLCTHFKNSATLPSADNRQGYALIGNNGGAYTVGFGATVDFPTTTAWQQFLADQYAAGTPVIIVYPLATPTTESVAGQTLQVTGGDNVLEITQAGMNGLELEAEYTKVA